MTPTRPRSYASNLVSGTEQKAPEPARRAASHARLARLGATALVLFMLVGALCAAPSSASLDRLLGRGPQGASAPAEARRGGSAAAKRLKAAPAPRFVPGLFAPLQQTSPPPAAETVATYEADCETAQTSFRLGDTVCVKVAGAPISPFFTQRRVQLLNPEGNIVESIDVSTSSQTNDFTLPSEVVVSLAGRNVDNRGRWRVNLTDTTDATARATAPLVVHDQDPQVKVSDLQISRSQVGSGAPLAGQDVSFEIHIYNMGPDTAENVRFSDSTLANTTFVSLTQTRGPAFSCTTPDPNAAGTSTCTAPALAEGQGSSFIVVYKLGTGILNNADLTGTTSVASDTPERRGDDNSSSSETSVRNPTPAACAVSCPDNITVGNGAGLDGAFVQFAAPSVSDGCGTAPLTIVPASGSFFGIGSSVVSAGMPDGQTCSFIVTVNDQEAPAVTSCPQNITVFESSAGSGSASVSYSVPASDNSGEVTVNCNHPSGSSFNVGTTAVTCMAFDAAGNSSEACAFNVTVEPRAAGCTLTQPDDVVVNSPAGSCGANVNFSLPAADGETCGTVSCDRQPGSFFPVGTTPVTCTSRPDGASTTFNVTVRDTTAPVPDLATLPTVTRSCAATLTTVPTATDSCGGKIGGSTDDPRTYEDAGTYTVAWKFTDEAGNTTTQPQTVVVLSNDVTPPTVNAPPAVTLYTGPNSCGVTVADLDATLGEPEANDACSGVSVARSGVPAGGTFPVGTTTVTYTATDESGNIAQATQAVTVIDNSLPTIALNGGPAMTVECHTPFADPGATAADNCQGAEVVKEGSVDANTPGVYTVSYRAKDASGNLSAAAVTRTVTVVDTTPPVVSCPADIVVYLPPNSTATSMPVSYAPTAVDACGDAEVVSAPASGSVFHMGTTPVTATATDEHDNSSSCTFNVTVLYNFTGFFQPVGNPPTLNLVKAGQGVPVKFSLSGNKGLGIFAADSPASAQVLCGSDAAVDLEDTVTAGGSSLSYNASGDQYNYVWKTEAAWAGTCRQLVLTLNDGSVHRANFKFK